MKFPDLNKIPPLVLELKEFQEFVKDVQRKYSQQNKIMLSNDDSYRLAFYILAKYGAK